MGMNVNRQLIRPGRSGKSELSRLAKEYFIAAGRTVVDTEWGWYVPKEGRAVKSKHVSWWWYVGLSSYEYGPFASREKAISYAIDEEELVDGFHLIEARKHDIYVGSIFDSLMVDHILERAEDYTEHTDQDGFSVFYDLTGKQRSSLADALADAANAWQRENGVVFEQWKFAETRNYEHYKGQQD